MTFIFIAPFIGSLFLLFLIVGRFFRFCKHTWIVFFLPLLSASRLSDNAESHRRDFTSRRTDNVDGLRRVKRGNLPEVLGFKKGLGLQAAAQHEHVSHAVDHQVPQAFAEVQLIKSVKIAVWRALLEVF
ncbi:hypothetical protein D4760_11255 [Eubacterium callanderi]|nr:hypothetical protein [Eubacterium callanderi]